MYDGQTRTRPHWSVPAGIFGAHALVFAALTWWSWGKWPDPLVDFGRELYVPWQITRGKVLYRELASLFGPLSPYVNAFWFRLFGVSLTTLAACNLVILAATAAGLYHLLQISTDRVTATAATVTVLTLCGFSQYVDVGNYNFVAPYSHEATHGIALSVAALVTWYHAIRLKRALLFATSGLCVGLVLLTKPEIAVSAMTAIAVGLVAARRLDSTDQRLWQGAVIFAAGAAAGPLLFLAYFRFAANMWWDEAARAVAAAWTPAFSPALAGNLFYLRTTGLDDVAGNVTRIARALIGFGVFVMVSTGVAVALGRPHRRNPLQRALDVGATVTLALVAAAGVLRGGFSPALPLVTIAVCTWALVVYGRAGREYVGAGRERSFSRLELLPLLMWSAFAVVLLAKMGLNARLYRYGFYLALPAVSVTVVLLLWLVPRTLDALNGRAVATRARLIFAASVFAVVAAHVTLANVWYRTKVVTVGSGGDRFLASSAPDLWQGAAVETSLEWLNTHTRADATVAVLPEGVMINFLSRRETSVPFVNFMPPELIVFGEHRIVGSLEAHPPDFVLLVHKNVAEYGYPSFGADPRYGRQLLSWVMCNYENATVIGRDPMSEAGVGIQILRRLR